MNDLKEIMRQNPELRLAVAESLTSGRLQARVGAISGASEFFLGGVTAYTLDEKVRLLWVDPVDAGRVNSVSEGVARQMAEGACRRFKGNVGIATTGYAEPSPANGVDAPFAWWAIALKKPRAGYAFLSRRVDCPGMSRVEVQERVAAEALDALVAWLRETAAARTP